MLCVIVTNNCLIEEKQAKGLLCSIGLQTHPSEVVLLDEFCVDKDRPMNKNCFNRKVCECLDYYEQRYYVNEITQKG